MMMEVQTGDNKKMPSMPTKVDAKSATRPQMSAPMAHVDHKAAIAKMNHEHVHKLVQMAHEGKMGPEAQGMAQKAMAGPAMQDSGASGMPPAKTNPFMSGPDEEEQPQAAPESRASMFGGGRSF
jgi:hypothetical protein